MTASKLDQLRALREARISSRGGVEHEHTEGEGARSGLRPAEERVSAAEPTKAGVVTGPREASRKGRPRIESRDKTLKATKPWLKLGMSERTWYRRQREQKNKKGG